MANLKDLKTRINSVTSTQKITSAMKMVAAAKLRRAQEAAESGRPYAARMKAVVASLAEKADKNSALELLVGRTAVKTHLLVIISADKGLCGGFNGSVARLAKHEMNRLESEGKSVQVYFVGRKAADALGSVIADRTFARIEGVQGTNIGFESAREIASKIIAGFEEGQFDAVSMIFNRFVNAITQEVTHTSLIPVQIDESEDEANESAIFYDYEPEEVEILSALLPRNMSTQLFSALLESSAAELAARMTAMDNATRNAGDMIDRLTLVYNRTRQANITKELIEIISGAEAL
ncbi:MAG: F0F1 ATP synthase subunit gamma [Rhodospirillaceae bacterium]|nr:F0F1 ATP synthase subunit gamma [Rhodospirillaceae bacterium]|tara:strand:+ start:9 stop:887 length:879 start_codon:yes stop_codon:yes gene_type:complete